MEKLKNLIKNLIYLSTVDLKKELRPTVSLQELNLHSKPHDLF
jgi:hypothetical protein